MHRLWLVESAELCTFLLAISVHNYFGVRDSALYETLPATQAGLDGPRPLPRAESWGGDMPMRPCVDGVIFMGNRMITMHSKRSPMLVARLMMDVCAPFETNICRSFAVRSLPRISAWLSQTARPAFTSRAKSRRADENATTVLPHSGLIVGESLIQGIRVLNGWNRGTRAQSRSPKLPAIPRFSRREFHMR